MKLRERTTTLIAAGCLELEDCVKCMKFLGDIDKTRKLRTVRWFIGPVDTIDPILDSVTKRGKPVFQVMGRKNGVTIWRHMKLHRTGTRFIYIFQSRMLPGALAPTGPFLEDAVIWFSTPVTGTQADVM